MIGEDMEHKVVIPDEWLPKDADSVPIRVGDRLVTSYPFGEFERTVEALILTDRWDFELSDEDGDTRDVADMSDFYENTHHAPEDTWERIIEDARTCTGSMGNHTAIPTMRWTNDMDVLVARCKALAGEGK